MFIQNAKNSLSVANLDNRTTSPLESYHSSLNRSIPKHANFFVFVSHLILHESRRSEDLLNAINDRSPLAKAAHKRDQDRDNKIRTNTKLLCDGSISTEQFLKSMALEDRRMCIH